MQTLAVTSCSFDLSFLKESMQCWEHVFLLPHRSHAELLRRKVCGHIGAHQRRYPTVRIAHFNVGHVSDQRKEVALNERRRFLSVVLERIAIGCLSNVNV